MKRGAAAHRVTSVHHANVQHARHASRGGMRTIRPTKSGQHALHFREGGLHASTGTPAGQKISAKKHAEAASGALGKKAEKQERFYRNVLK